MTHSTCCKAEVKKYSDMGQSWYMCSKCEQPCDVITPPPVPSEIEEEIREIVEKILDKHTLNYTKTGDKDFNPPEIISFDTVVLNKYEAQEEMIKAITALITHHTSEKVKEEKNKLIKALEKVFDNDMKKTWDKGSEIGAQFAGYARGVLSRAIATAQAAEGEGE